MNDKTEDEDDDRTTAQLKAALQHVRELKQWIEKKRNSTTPLTDGELELVKEMVPKIAAMNKALDEILPNNEWDSKENS
jgi:hypothetical protein